MTTTQLAGRLTTKGRSGPGQKIRIRLGENGRWVIDTLPARERTIRERLVDVVEAAAAPVTAAEIAAVLGVSTKTVQNAVGELVARRDVVPHGLGTKNDPRRYSPPVDDDGADGVGDAEVAG